MTGRVDWVVLDLGETLVDETRRWAAVADRLGVPHLTLFALIGAAIAERRPHTDALAPFTTGPVPEARLTEADLYPDALPALRALREAGLRLAVMANQPLTAMPLLARLPVDLTATSAGWGVAKPDPAFFARVVQEVGSEPGRIAYLGDRVDHDVLPAKAAGMLAVHLRRGPWGHVQAGWPEAGRADLRCDSLAGAVAALTAQAS